VVVESSSNNPLVPVTAFRDNAAKRCVVVVLNNDIRPHVVEVKAGQGDWPASGRVAAEQSTQTAYWQPVRASRVIQLPPGSITTLVENDTVTGTAPVVRARAQGATLDGSVTGKTRSIAWIQIYGPGRATIDNPASLRTTVSNLQPGEYAFRLFAVGEDWRAGSATVRMEH